jgi:recombinational DNA repair protein RecR
MRLQKNPSIREVILATGMSLEGETTSMFISREVKARFPSATVSRLGKNHGPTQQRSYSTN